MAVRATRKAAAKRYTLRMLGLMLAYMVILFAVGWAFHHHQLPAGPLRYLAAAAPALPIIGVIWAMQRFIEEEDDEYQRLLHGRTQAVATGVTMAVCTVWGLLEIYGGVPKAGMFWVFLVWMVALPPSQWWVCWRASR